MSFDCDHATEVVQKRKEFHAAKRILKEKVPDAIYKDEDPLGDGNPHLQQCRGGEEGIGEGRTLREDADGGQSGVTTPHNDGVAMRDLGGATHLQRQGPRKSCKSSEDSFRMTKSLTSHVSIQKLIESLGNVH